MTHFVAVDKDLFRKVRLFHWFEYLRWQNIVQKTEQGTIKSARALKQANFHIKTVQALNDLFPAGDTAEQDAKKVDTRIVDKSELMPTLNRTKRND